MNIIKFLSLEPEAFGIDFSDLRLRIVSLSRNKKYLSLASYSEVKVPPGVISDGDVLDEEKLIISIKKAVNTVKGPKIKTKYVIASLPETKAFLQVIKVPKMTAKELKIAMPFEIENYIPITSDKTYLDYQPIYQTSEDTKTLDVLIGAMLKEVIDPYVYCLNKAGLIPKALEVESQSIARAVINNQISPFPYLIIDFGKTTTSFIVFSGQSLRFTSTIGIAADDITRAIAKDLKITFAKAESLKIKYGLEDIDNTTQNKNVKKSVNFVVDRLMKETKKYIDYYHTHSNDIPTALGGGEIKKIFLCGGGANLAGLKKFISHKAKISTDLANPWVNITDKKAKEIPQMSFGESLGYTTALGLALRGISNDYD